MTHATRALITGASAGIGATFARQLAAKGVNLVLVARRADRLDDLAAEIRAAHKVEVEVLAADLGERVGLQAVEERLAADPAVDMLVNNAGFGVYSPLEKADPNVLEEMIQLNVVALMRLAHAAVGPMLARGAGTIINVASGLAFRILPTNATYSGTKAFVVNFTRALHQDVGGRGVQVQCLVPGIVRTEFGLRSGADYDKLPQEIVMNAGDLVAASLKGLEMGEVVCIPSLPDYADYQALEAAQAKVAEGGSRDVPAARYR